MEVITYKKQTSKTKCIIEAALEYRPKKNKHRGFDLRKYGMLKNLLLRARKTKVRGSVSIFKYFRTINFLA